MCSMTSESGEGAYERPATKAARPWELERLCPKWAKMDSTTRECTMSIQSLDYYVLNPAWLLISSAIATVRSHFPGGCQWDVDRMPDLQGDVAIVTGGNTGIGKATCKVCMISSFLISPPYFVSEIRIWRPGTPEEECEGLSRREE